MLKHYVYIYYYPGTNIPFYVGMGYGDRYKYHLKEAKKNLEPVANEHKLNTIRKILRDGKTPEIRIIESGVSAEDAKDFEVLLIEVIGRQDLKAGPLTNRTNGGDGNSGWTEEDKEKCRQRNKDMGIVPPSRKGQPNKRHCYEDNLIPAKDPITGERFHASVVDPRWATGEIVGVNQGCVWSDIVKQKHSDAISKLKWWNNGTESVRTKEKPKGEEWVAGRLSFKMVKKKLTCPHCGKQGQPSNMQRWHFDNCKHKT